jgi:hypothetical protein
MPAGWIRRRLDSLTPIAVAAIVLLSGHAAVASAQPSFTLGSPAADVRQAQGIPTVIERLHSLGLEIWTFGAASVRLSADSMRVIGWDNAARTLRATLRPGPNATTALTFGAGSPADDVVRLMGTPTAVREDRARGTMLWRYGSSAVTIALSDARVVAWINPGGNLRVARPHTPLGSLATSRGGRGIDDGSRIEPRAPATLSASVGFREPSGNGALEGAETATVTVELRNRGPGVAHDVRVGVSPDSGDATLVIGTTPPIARLDAGATTRVTIPVSAPLHTRDGQVTLRVTVVEANGFDLDVPRRLTIPVRATRPAQLAISGMRADDQSGDGRITPRELVEVTARVWNAGTGAARDVKGSLSTSDDAFLVAEAARDLTLGTIAPGEHRDVTFVFYTNTRARDVRVLLTLTESTGQFGATLTLPFSIDRATTQTLDATIAAVVPDDSVPSSPASVLDEIERDLPPAAEKNPDAIAVIFGVERYATLPSARFAARDARLFARYAATTLGVPDDRNHVYVRTDADASGNELRKVFGDEGWLARRVQPTTDLYVFFAGHGAPDLKARTPYLLPADADAAYPRETGYALKALYDQLARLDVRSVTVILDACFTGATRSSGTLFGGARNIVISVEHPALLRDNFAVIAAAHGDQIASDFPEKRHGLFSYYTMLGLRGAADADGDRTVTIAELERYLEREVPRVAASLDREQVPVVIARQKDRALVRLGGAP